MVQVLHLALVDHGLLDLLAGPERLVERGAGADVAERGAHEGAALARLDVLELDHLVEALRQVEAHAVLQVVGGDGHVGSFGSKVRVPVRSRRVFGVSVRAAAVGGDDDRVLDAHTAVLGEVDARFDGDDAAVDQRSSRGPAHPGVLVDVETHAVAGAVQEGVGPAGLVDDRAAGRVDVLAADPGGHRGDAGRLGLEDHVEHPLLGRARLPHHDGAGHVRVVAVDQRAEVDHHEVAFGDRSGAGPVVGHGPVGAGRHDRLEAHVVGPEPAHRGVELQAELLLGGPLGQPGPDLGQRGVGDGGRPPRCRATSPSSFTSRSAVDQARWWAPARCRGTSARRRGAAPPT